MHLDVPVAVPLSTSALLRLDRWWGGSLCLALTGWRRLFAERPATAPLRRILFLKFAEQGSTVLACAAIRRATGLVGRENVYFAVLRQNRFILDAMDLIPRENVITLDPSGLPQLVAGAGVALQQIRRIGIDATVDLEFFSRATAAFGYLTGARRRVGLHASTPYRGDLLTHRVNYNPALHTAQMFDVLVASLSAEPEKLPAFDECAPIVDPNLPAFQPVRADLERIRAMLPAGAGRLILLNPNAGDLLPLRRWPAERYAALANRILAEIPDSRVIFTGAPGEADAANGLAASLNTPRCSSLAGRTTLPELLALYTLADALITNDSGPAHFAALTPIRTVTLFGPETPALFAPLNPRSTVIWRGIACSPCVTAYNHRQSACRNNLCMQGITVDQVFAALQDRLSDSRSL